MPNYTKSKIYKIVPICEYDEEDCYIGSTTRPLSERMNEHRCDFKNKKGNCQSKILFEKYGVENCKILLIEEFSCDNKEQLNKKEGEHQLLNKCINKRVAGRTKAEWYINNAERIKENHTKNAEKIKEYMKQYRIDNSEKIKEQEKQYKLNKKVSKSLGDNSSD